MNEPTTLKPGARLATASSSMPREVTSPFWVGRFSGVVRIGRQHVLPLQVEQRDAEVTVEADGLELDADFGLLDRFPADSSAPVENWCR